MARRLNRSRAWRPLLAAVATVITLYLLYGSFFDSMSWLPTVSAALCTILLWQRALAAGAGDKDDDRS